MFLTKIRNIFCVDSHTNFVSATNVARKGKRGNIFVRNSVSSFAGLVLNFGKLHSRSHSPFRVGQSAGPWH